MTSSSFDGADDERTDAVNRSGEDEYGENELIDESMGDEAWGDSTRISSPKVVALLCRSFLLRAS
jgi:hypothetical protein